MNDDERGSATVLVLALVGVLSLVAALLVAVGALTVARHRADSAADLAALAAAVHVVDGRAAACRVAAEVAERAGGRVSACLLQGDVAVVTVEVLPPAGLAELGPARAVARAGPS